MTQYVHTHRGQPRPNRDRPDVDLDDRWTPSEFFDQQNVMHKFTLDAAASAANAKCARHFTKEVDGLAQSWAGETVWCNPPYSKLSHWVEKARRETIAGCPKAVLLVPANRTESPWWHEFVEPFRERPGSGVRTEFVRKRIRFASPHGLADGRPPFGSVLIIFTPPSTEQCDRGTR